MNLPIACFRKGMAREYFETEALPPPSTCYGFLLSLVGETERRRHVGVRVTAGLIGQPDVSVVLRTMWRVKSKPLGSSGNTRPDYQQLLSGIELVLWLDSTEEASDGPTLEARVSNAVVEKRFAEISRFGGLSLGESTHLVDEILPVTRTPGAERHGQLFLRAERGRFTFPVWVDHVGSAGTRYVTGDLVERPIIEAPQLHEMPSILPLGG